MNEGFSDRLDILKHVSEIKLRLKDDITNDFVLAKLGEKDKEFIIEMTGNAYFSKRLLDILVEKGEEWIWENDKYVKKPLSENDKERIRKISKAVFDSYMIKIYMTVVLNRNVDQNYLINVLSGYVDRAEKEMGLGPDDSEIGDYIKNLVSDQSKSKEK